MKILKPALSGMETWAGDTIHVQQISVWLKCNLLDVITGTETTLIPLSFSCLLWYIYLRSYFVDQPYITSVRLLSCFSVMWVGPVFEKAEGQIFDTVILKLKTVFLFPLFYVSADISSKIAEDSWRRKYWTESQANCSSFVDIFTCFL